MRCPRCNGLVVYDHEKVEFVCALCESIVTELLTESPWPYPQEFLESVYATKIMAGGKEEKARKIIRKHAVGNTAAALSGKDSLVALHLTLSTGVSVDVIISTHIAKRRLPQKVVDGLKAIAESLGARRVVIFDEPWDVHASLFRIIARKYNYDVIITGLRRGENRGHIHAVESHLVEPGRTVKLVNPIIDWSTAEVWSYLFHYRLPILTLVPYRYAPPDASLQHLV
jgi:3'-phosphoadenosine 5'-phosphosulfate sulfotransferase (PAPS reductase)/FAD synthetase